MISPTQTLAVIPNGLRDPLLAEYNSIVRNFMDRKWSPSELSGGKFCEIVYTILDGYAKGSFPNSPRKPSSFVDACKKLEQNGTVPRSFQILIPRILPALYEIRNNRGVGHVGGDVDPNHMDATAVLSMSSWIMSELVRVFHNLKIDDAQKVVDSLIERRVPLVWQSGEMKRVLDPKMSLPNQILLLISSSPASVETELLFNWTGSKDKKYFFKLLRKLHDSRLVELSADQNSVQLLPPGANYVETKIIKHK